MVGNKSGNRIKIRKNITIQLVQKLEDFAKLFSLFNNPEIPISSIEFQQLLQNCIPTVFRADANVDKKRYKTTLF